MQKNASSRVIIVVISLCLVIAVAITIFILSPINTRRNVCDHAYYVMSHLVTNSKNERLKQICQSQSLTNDNISEAKKLLDEEADPNQNGYYPSFPLVMRVIQHYRHREIDRGNAYELIKALLEHGADPNSKDEDGYTPLDTANGNLEMTRLLLRYGARRGSL